MDHFNSLPDEIIAMIFRFFLAIDSNRLIQKYSLLHRVCRRWNSVRVHWADHLPKYGNQFCIHISDYNGFLLKNRQKCIKYVGSHDGQKFMGLLRHYDTESLIFEQMYCTDKLLLQLVENRLTSVRCVTFKQCDMAGVTEEVMTTFLAAVAHSKHCKELIIYDIRSSDRVFSDQSLDAVIKTGMLEKLKLSVRSTEPWNKPFDITDDTLVNLALNLPPWNFDYTFGFNNNSQDITAQGVYQIIKVCLAVRF
jgi:hypothetical protein